MMNMAEYAYASVGGAAVIMGSDFIGRDQPWYAVAAFVVFGITVCLLRMQPTNVSDGVIVRVSALDVFTFVNGRDVKWCGTKHLHNIHSWTSNVTIKPGDVNHTFYVERGTDVVCLGHECQCPESHMQRIGHE